MLQNQEVKIFFLLISPIELLQKKIAVSVCRGRGRYSEGPREQLVSPRDKNFPVSEQIKKSASENIGISESKIKKISVKP